MPLAPASASARKEVLTFVSHQVASAIERKQSEEAMLRSEARYRSLVQSAVVNKT